MSLVVVTGAGGLVGAEAVRYFASEGFDVAAIENDMRARFFGDSASTARVSEELKSMVKGLIWEEADIRDGEHVTKIFKRFGDDIGLVVHAAAQPSHDWAASDPHMDFSVNAVGTLNMLEATRKYCPEAAFIFCSTNKVYGDAPNRLSLVEGEMRYELESSDRYYKGIDTSMSIDQTLHSLFGVSKAAADLMVQEYGRYFGMPTACFRCGCITGPGHAGAKLHGFLSYLMKCAVTGDPYTVFGYGGKQVRDNIHSYDLVKAFDEFRKAPQTAVVYNIGGGRQSNCSMLEAITLCEEIAGKGFDYTLGDDARVGDHIWWISDNSEFIASYPEWQLTYGIEEILQEIFEQNVMQWRGESS